MVEKLLKAQPISSEEKFMLLFKKSFLTYKSAKFSSSINFPTGPSFE